MRLKEGEHDFLIAASENETGSAYSYNLNKEYEKNEIWNNIGGTMTMVQIPESLSFLATQRFYPGFNAASCELVRLSFVDGKWEQKKVRDFPYLHRFDLIERNSKIYFIGATITEKKEYMEDWRTPGSIYVGEYDRNANQLINLKVITNNLIKNHGYSAFKEKNYSLITSEEGIFRLNYPTSESDWSIQQVYDLPVSDIAAIDFYQTGELSHYLVINKFHGKKLTILNNKFQIIKEIEEKFPFSHSIWGGVINGKPCFLFGNREGKQDYYMIDLVEEDSALEVKFNKIDHQVGSTNTLVYNKNDINYIASANREINQVAIYQ